MRSAAPLAMNTVHAWLIGHRLAVRVGWVLLLTVLAACNTNDSGGGPGGY